jgi:kumamolisin
VVHGVFGLDNRPQARPHFRRFENVVPLQAGPHASFTPIQVGQLYDFPSKLDGSGQCIGIIELGGGFRTGDIQAYFSQLGLKPPTVVAVSVDHTNNHPTVSSGDDGEVMLDIEVAGAIAPGAKYAVYFAPNTDQGFIDAITTAVHDTTNRPSILSISWGGPEASWTAASQQTMDQAFQAAAALGISVYCASGDSGSGDGDPGNNVDFPASSPNVTGCGGTHITQSGGAITQEVVWNDPGGGATGGGQSTVFGLPPWQTDAVKTQQPAFTNRGVPDVAGDASPDSGYIVRVDGQTLVFGGTSAVAPLWAGLTALLNQSLGKSIGFINPTIYGLASSSGAFHDITAGSNGAYNAGAGWDPCTGLGSPDGSRLLKALTPVPVAATVAAGS